MSKIELNVSGRKYVVSAKESEEHLKEVAAVVQQRIEEIKKESPSATFAVAALLAAFDFASSAMKGKKSGEAYRSALLKKAHQVLEMVETELADSHPQAH